jgi:transposase-like protein
METEKKEQEIRCPACGSEDIRKNGFLLKKNKRIQRHQCTDCALNFTMETQEESMESLAIYMAQLMLNLGENKYIKEVELANGLKLDICIELK